MNGWVLIVIFILVFVGWVAFGKHSGWSRTIRFAGGFVVGLMAMLIFGVTMMPDNGNGDAVAPAIAPEVSAKPQEAPAPPEKTITNEEASKLAKETVKVIDQAKRDFKLVLETGDQAGYVQYITKPLQGITDKWPSASNATAALTPYRACYYAAFDFEEYASTFVTNTDNVRNRKYRESTETDFNKHYSACQTDINHPDLTLIN